MHGADYDLRLLDRDLGLRIRGLFDTQAAASLLGEEALGLSSLLEKYLDVRLAKEHQRADWARRPLSPELLEYAASDTRYLLELQDRLAEELERRGRLPWAHEEFQTLEEVRWEEDRTDPVTRVKGARELSAREVTALRRAMEWRDEIARERDRAPFRVMGNKVLLEVVAQRPATPKELEEMKGVSARLARQKGQELLARIRAVDTLPEDALEPYPPWQGNGGGRPTPEEQTLMDRIRDLRTERSRKLGLDRGVLLTNAQILDIVRSAPQSLQDLEALPGVKRWQTEVLGPEILAILQSAT
jgi:ribonuclease D